MPRLREHLPGERRRAGQRGEGAQVFDAHWATILVLRLSDRASMHPGCRQVTALLA